MQLPNENKALLNRKHTLILLIAAGVLGAVAAVWAAVALLRRSRA